MANIYIIELDESHVFGDSTRTYETCFDSYDSAKEYLLNYFNQQISNGEEYFTLKNNAQYSSDFRSGDTAVIKVLNLAAPKVNVFDKMIDNLKDEEFMKKVISKMHEE